MATNPNDKNQNFVSNYPPAMALEFLTEHFKMTELSLANEYRMSRNTLARIRKGEHLPRSYDHYMRKFVQILEKKRLNAMVAGDFDLSTAIMHLFGEMFRAHYAMVSDFKFQCHDYNDKYVAP